MATKKSENSEWLQSLETVVSAYEEIAAQRMQKVRQSVLFNRDFMAELNSMFQQVKSSYRRQIKKLKIRGPLKNGKTVRVFISANTGFYGDIVQRIYRVFEKDLGTTTDDLVIIGSLGKTLLERKYPHRQYTYFDLPDSLSQVDMVKKVCLYLATYERVIFYHGIFKNIVHQDAVAVDVSGSDVPSSEVTGGEVKIIFEPSLWKVLNFFETEIFSSLLLHSFYEAQLAKFAARMWTLDTAQQQIKMALATSLFEEQKVSHREANRKQQSMVIGTHFWQG